MIEQFHLMVEVTKYAFMVMFGVAFLWLLVEIGFFIRRH